AKSTSARSNDCRPAVDSASGRQHVTDVFGRARHWLPVIAAKSRRPGAALRAADRAQPWADRLARVGYVAKGAVFLLVGGLAVAAAAGAGGKATDPSGALATVARHPAGRIALAVTALGLLAHAGFRAALVGVGEPYAARGPVLRFLRGIANAFSALIYLGMAVTAGALATGWRALAHTDKDAQTQHWSARLMAAPYGRPLLIGIAIGVLVAAVVQVVRAVGPNPVRRRLRVEEMSEWQCQAVAAVGRVAFLARATVLGVVGYYLIRAGIDSAPRLARGPAGAMQAVWHLPHGDLLLATLGAGLIAFGAYGLLEARWRRLLGR
ncbi:MAG: DUF1206 domain-containing protein, partial [Myxococcales bacterium]